MCTNYFTMYISNMKCQVHITYMYVRVYNYVHMHVHIYILVAGSLVPRNSNHKSSTTALKSSSHGFGVHSANVELPNVLVVVLGPISVVVIVILSVK